MRNKIIFIVTFFIVLSITILIFFIEASPKKQQTIQSLPTPTPIKTQGTQFQKVQELEHFVTQQQEESVIPPNQIEQAYPSEAPQDFSYQQTSDHGSLIITTSPSDARVVIDSTTSDDGKGASLPNNFSPFRADNIPAGYYSIVIEKHGYVYQNLVVRISPFRVTRLHVTLPKIDEAL